MYNKNSGLKQTKIRIFWRKGALNLLCNAFTPNEIPLFCAFTLTSLFQAGIINMFLFTLGIK